MSGVTEMGDKVLVERCRCNLHNLNDEGLESILQIWGNIYGNNDANQQERLSKVEHELKAFWEYQVEAQEERKNNLLTSIERTGKEAFDLEAALGLESKVSNIKNDMPLVDLEEQLWTILESYQKQKEQILKEYSENLNKEKSLCKLLDETPQFLNLSQTHVNTASEARSVHRGVPSSDDMERLKKRIQDLEELRDQLFYDFKSCKEELRSLLQECEVLPLKKVECFAFSVDDGTIDFPINNQNLETLKASIQSTREKKNGMILEAEHLREEITSLSKKMLKDPEQLEAFLNQHSGFTEHVLEKLKEKLKALKEERRLKLKDLILEHRILLDEWWTRCCYSDDQRAQFHPYNVDYYSEDVLGLHELELEQVQRFYSEHKRIFQLAQKHRELWDRLLQLEEAATQTDRLFSNRGGKLLQEEKERKVIQKKEPAIRAELMTLLNKYKDEQGKDFLYLGAPLMEILLQTEEERNMTKENKKLTRKAANKENILLESRLGARPVPAANIAGTKRKIATPQLPASAGKTMKMTPLSSATNSTASTASYKSAASSVFGQKVMKEEIREAVKRGRSPGRGLRPATSYATLHTPDRVLVPTRRFLSPGREIRPGTSYATLHTPVITPAASTPENGLHREFKSEGDLSKLY